MYPPLKREVRVQLQNRTPGSGSSSVSTSRTIQQHVDVWNQLHSLNHKAEQLKQLDVAFEFYSLYFSISYMHGCCRPSSGFFGSHKVKHFCYASFLHCSVVIGRCTYRRGCFICLVLVKDELFVIICECLRQGGCLLFELSSLFHKVYTKMSRSHG